MAHKNCSARRNVYKEVADVLQATASVQWFSRELFKAEIELICIDLGIIDENRSSLPHFQTMLAVLDERGCLEIHREDHLDHYVSMNVATDKYSICSVPEKSDDAPVQWPAGSHLMMDNGELVQVLSAEVPYGVTYRCRTAKGEIVKLNTDEFTMQLFDVESWKLV